VNYACVLPDELGAESFEPVVQALTFVIQRIDHRVGLPAILAPFAKALDLDATMLSKSIDSVQKLWNVRASSILQVFHAPLPLDA
jgi:hypothetical protein